MPISLIGIYKTYRRKPLPLDGVRLLGFNEHSKAKNTHKRSYDYFRGTGGYNAFIASKIKVDYSDYERNDKRITRRKEHNEKARKIKRGKNKTKELEARIAALEGK